MGNSLLIYGPDCAVGKNLWTVGAITKEKNNIIPRPKTGNIVITVSKR